MTMMTRRAQPATAHIPDANSLLGARIARQLGNDADCDLVRRIDDAIERALDRAESRGQLEAARAVLVPHG